MSFTQHLTIHRTRTIGLSQWTNKLRDYPDYTPIAQLPGKSDTALVRWECHECDESLARTRNETAFLVRCVVGRHQDSQ